MNVAAVVESGYWTITSTAYYSCAWVGLSGRERVVVLLGRGGCGGRGHKLGKREIPPKDEALVYHQAISPRVQYIPAINPLIWMLLRLHAIFHDMVIYATTTLQPEKLAVFLRARWHSITQIDSLDIRDIHLTCVSRHYLLCPSRLNSGKIRV